MSGPLAEVAPGARVGFVGLGRMGRPMLGRLVAAGYRVTGYDADAAVRERVRGEVPAADVAEELTAVAAGAAAVVLMLPDSAVVAAVLGALAGRLRSGQVVVDMGSSEPAETVRHARSLAAAQVGLVDAPVSGGVAGAESGTLTVMVGGEEADARRVTPLLSQLGARIVRVGPAGAGHAVKALNNLLSASHLLATSEALAVAARFGLDAPTVLDAINTSSGRSGSSEVKWPRHVLPGTYDSGFALRLMLKDVGIAVSLARSVGGAAPLAEETVRLWSQAAAALPADADHTEVARWVAERSGAAAGSGGKG